MKSKGGRPQIDWDDKRIKTFEAIISIPAFATHGITLGHIADAMSVSEASLKRWIPKQYPGMSFELLKKQKEGTVRLNLATKLYQTAMAGNVTAMIFALKNWAGMSDKQETAITLEGISITIQDQDKDL